jgi:hypothetical protein
MLTKKQLEKFVKVRNKSPHSSNLQFAFDCEECGFTTSDIGDPQKVVAAKGGRVSYVWRTKVGVLVETQADIGGWKLSLYKPNIIINAETGRPLTRDDLAA